MLAKAKPAGLTTKISTCLSETRTTCDLATPSSKDTSSYRSATTCQRPARCVRSLFGTCSGHQLLTNVNGECYSNFSMLLMKYHVSFRCRIKVHKDHIDSNDPLAPCKLHHDPNSARDMLLLATSPEDQNKWVSRLSKRIQKSGYKANSTTNNLNSTLSSNDGTKISPR